MGHSWLDKFCFGEETLNRWDRERQNSNFLTLVERTENKICIRNEKDAMKKNEDFYDKELRKYGHGHVFKLDEIPEIFKDKIIEQTEGLEKNKLAKKENIILYSIRDEEHSELEVSWNFFGWRMKSSVYLRVGGFKYCENEKGEPALRVVHKQINY